MSCFAVKDFIYKKGFFVDVD